MRTEAALKQLDPWDLWRQLIRRLPLLPQDTYLRCIASFLAEYRRLYYDSDVPAGDYLLVDRIVELAAQAATGAQVRAAAVALDREWRHFTSSDEDDDDDQPYRGPVPMELFKACSAMLWELTDETHRYESADYIADGALNHESPDDPVANTRLLLDFIDKVEREISNPNRQS